MNGAVLVPLVALVAWLIAKRLTAFLEDADMRAVEQRREGLAALGRITNRRNAERWD